MAVRLRAFDPVVAVQLGLFLLGELAVGLDVGRVLDRALAERDDEVPSRSAASASGTNVRFVPNKPVLTRAHSGSSVSASR